MVAGGGSGDPFCEGGRGTGSGDCLEGGAGATGELRGGVGSLAPREGGRRFTSSSGSVCSGGSGLYSRVISARPVNINIKLYQFSLYCITFSNFYMIQTFAISYKEF